MRSRIEGHLGACRSCRQALRETEAVIGFIRDDAPAEPSAAFWQDYRATLRERYAESLQRTGQSNFSLARLRTPRFAYALAVASLCIIAIAVGTRLYGPGRTPTPGTEPFTAISSVDEWMWSDSLQLASLTEEEIAALDALTIDLEDPSVLDPALGPAGGLTEEITALEPDEVDQLYDSLIQLYPEIDHNPPRSTDQRDRTIGSRERRWA